MIVILISKKKQYKLKLPKEITGNYVITEKIKQKEKILLNIQAVNGKWQIETDRYSRIINPKNIIAENNCLISSQTKDSIIPSCILEENKMYALCIGNEKEINILYCAPDDEKDFEHKDIVNTNTITIGTGDNNTIIYKNTFVSEKHVQIFKKNGKWLIENFDQQYGTFVNNTPLFNNIKILLNGDLISIMGLKLIIIKDSIYINKPSNLKLNEQYFIESKIKNAPLDENNLREDDEIIEMEAEEKNFNRAPRLLNIIEKEKVNIDEPPQKNNEQQRPLILMLGSSIAMGLMAVLSLSNAIQGIAKGTADTLETVIAFLTSFLMIFAMLIIPILDIKYDKKTKKKNEKKRQQKYKEYLTKKQKVINQIKAKQKEKIYQNNVDAGQCANIIIQNNHRLWERKIEDDDFLSVRIGIGNVPLKIEISGYQDRFALDDDDLLDAYNELIQNSKTIENAPVTISLLKNNISAFISKNQNNMDSFIKNIILQLITFQSYADLKLVFLINDAEKWKYVKMLPHIWNLTKQVRFFADEYYDMNEISKYLEEELKSRMNKNANDTNNLENMLPYYLIITDDYEQIEKFKFITEISKAKTNYGFSLLCITEDIFKVPNECKVFVELEQDKASIYDNQNYTETPNEVSLDKGYDIPYEIITNKLSSIPIRATGNERTSLLPSRYSFLEMFNVGKIEQLQILDRWKNNDSTVSLKTPIGVDSNGDLILLDIHEKFHGPHGLIAGSTGSGKSEFIITYILSLAINYHPDDVTFLLIDYKGGGLAGAFEGKNFKLPHVVGKITNIDTNGLQRSLTSIQSELKRRQIMFNEARNVTNESTIDIYKYQRLYHDGIVKEPIPHLLIICDEFAELKQQQTEFMDELISVSRIGRSLGVHLILATQKPAGIVDDQIRSNSKFAICLKVQDTSDSIDVIKKQDAAYLKNAGQFYLQVGNDEYFVLGQSGWAGEKYTPSDVIKKKVDTSIDFISNIGEITKKVDNITKQVQKNSKEEQLSSIVKHICEISNHENISKNNLWLENIPNNIYVEELRKKYRAITTKQTEAILGEYDDPFNQKQGLVKINYKNKDNIIILGNAESGKETLISTMIYDTITHYGTEEIQFYILDFGSEALKIYKNAPHVGDIIYISDEEKTDRFFEMIKKEMQNRKNTLSNYNGDYELYLSKGNKMPRLVLILNNYENFDENNQSKYEDELLAITRDCPKYGIIFITTVSSSNSMKYRLCQNFNKRIALQMNNEDEYTIIFNQAIKMKPAHIFGRGLICDESGNLFEFQTARICDYSDYNIKIEETIKELNEKYKEKAKPIPVIPDVLKIQDVKEELKDVTQVPLGMINSNFEIYKYNFKENFTTIVTGKNISYAIEYIRFIVEELKTLSDVNVTILDAEEIKKNKKITLEEAFQNFKNDIEKNIKNKNEQFYINIIIGINKFISEEAVDEFDLAELMKHAEESEKYSFIIIDNPNLLKNCEYQEWYQNYIRKDCGIWIGSGITDQTIISNNIPTFGVSTDYDNSYAYIVKEEDAILVKLIGMHKKGE